MFDTILGICVLLSLLLGTAFLVYVVTIIIPFVRRVPEMPGNPAQFQWHFVIPCRDEEAVIGGTIRYLQQAYPQAHIWVVDDHSDDSTATIVDEASSMDSRVHLCRRRLPEARTGKAEALNFAWKRVRTFLGPGADLDHVIMAVVDADGRPSANLLEICSGPTMFGDRSIAAVQVEVRMSNRFVRRPHEEHDWSRNLIARTFVRMQDLEFRGPISAIQLSRRVSRTVNVGGNGQLARFSALIQIADENGPWRGSLLEDFELGLHFLLAGWRNAYTPDAWVDQEALYSLPRFITQRARWAQGTMQCARYLKTIWSNDKISNLGAMEITYFLLQPWMQILGTFVYPIPILVMAYNLTTYPVLAHDFLHNGGGFMLGMYAVIGIGEFAIWGFLYRKKCEPRATRVQAAWWGLYYVIYVFSVYAVSWKAFIQLLRKQNGWAKTVRNSEAVDPAQLIAKTR